MRGMFGIRTPLKFLWVKRLCPCLIARDVFSFLEKTKEVLASMINISLKGHLLKASFYKHPKGYAPYPFR
jgi:hypothetical protein